MPDLLRAQQDLLNGILDTGPARWALIVKPVAAYSLRPALASYLNVQKNQNGHTGLLVSPAPTWHNWHAAGWHGPTITPMGFSKPVPEDQRPKFGTVVIDELPNYSNVFMERLDELLLADAEFACIWLPQNPSVELGRLLAKHRFVNLNIN